MNAYRICPKCKEAAPLGRTKCLSCNADLGNQPIIWGSAPRQSAAAEGNTPQSATNGCAADKREVDKALYAVNGLIRICDDRSCGAINSPAARICRLCGEDISTVAPVGLNGEIPVDAPSPAEVAAPSLGASAEAAPRAGAVVEEKAASAATPAASPVANPAATPAASALQSPVEKNALREEAVAAYETELNYASTVAYYLDAYEGGYSFRVPEGETLVGRTEAMREYLSTRSYVSRVHCKLILEDGALCIINLSRTNYTYCNGARVGERLILGAGDLVGLGGILVNGKPQSRAAVFTVRKEELL